MVRWFSFVLAVWVALAGLSACALLPHKTCHFCGAALAAHTAAGAGEHTPEGFEVCHQCKLEAVRDDRTAGTLVGQVRASLGHLGLTFPWGTIPVKLGKFDNPHELGHCGAGRMVSAPGAPVQFLSITFVPGLPRFMFKAVAAHELTHAWSYLHGCPMHQDLALSEGAAMFVEYTYLQGDVSPQAKYLRQAMVDDRHPAYGGGLRRLLQYGKGHHQLQGVLAALKTRRTIPPGY